MSPRPDSLVLYKGQPAVVRALADKKLTVELPGGDRVSVRPKDVALLHPGPLTNLGQVIAATPKGDVTTAWELLDSGQTTLLELAELAYGAFTPATAWAAWLLVADGLYFSGAPDAITVHTATRVAETLATREARTTEERAWAAFVARLGDNGYAPEDARYLADVVTLALGQSETSRTLARLGQPQTRETAHALLLAIGYWTPADNPYPARLGVPVARPELAVGPLPDEPRRDLTHLLALAIDDEGSSDPDDALSLDGDTLWVHVADVAALVSPDSPADLEARARAANLYLPEGTVRMLPEEVTDRLALGLQPVSPALSFAFNLQSPISQSPSLTLVTPTWLRVTRTTYDAAEAHLDESPYRELLALADQRRAYRLANGAVEIDLPEAKVKVDEDGLVCIKPLPALRSRELVREAMLLVGEALGELAKSQELSLAYSVQEPPGEVELPADGMAGMFAQRRVMQRSRPSTNPGRHAGLGLNVYVQATSPLRRYLDLVAHQQLRAHLLDRPLLDTAAVVARIGTADAATGPVRAAERLSIQHWTLIYLLQNPDWRGEGIVVEQKQGRDVVLIPDLAWETEIYRRQPRPLNSVVYVLVESVDLPNLTARFRVG